MKKKIVIGALILSILHSILFYGQDLGISVVLFVVPMLIFISYTLISKNKVKNKSFFSKCTNQFFKFNIRII